MMETVTAIHISETNYTVEVVNYHDTTFALQIFGATGVFKAAIIIDAEECRKIANALLAAAGEPGATSKIVSNRAVIRPHVFEIGDDVETNDGIRGYIAGFQDATVIISTDNELIIQRGIADIEYTGDVDAAEDAK